MHKFLIPLAAAASTLAIASPASAQWYPQPSPYAAPYASPYAAPYAHNGIAFARSMEARVHNLRHQVRDLGRRNLLTRGQARSFERQARSVQRQIRRSARYGLSGHERMRIEHRIARIEQLIQQRIAVNMRHGNRHAYGNRYYGNRQGYGYRPAYGYRW